MKLDCLRIYGQSTDPRRAEIAHLLWLESLGRDLFDAPVRPTNDLDLAVVEQTLALVDRLCVGSPLVLVGDDLHWADDASLVVWHRLAQATGQVPLMLVGAYRPGTSSSRVGHDAATRLAAR